MVVMNDESYLVCYLDLQVTQIHYFLFQPSAQQARN